ncbi:hypothetical protein GGS21DRAFT_520121 [Xylaria nigripes]|nr:hypothetical protein GGS21DRAFT_520121 [Xylaria nigripes]
MPTSISSVPGLYRLPDEILLKILTFAMENYRPFALEYSVEVFKKFRDNKARVATLARLPLSQFHHAHDWVLVNSTSRRIRELSREAFFGGKDIIMTSRFIDRLRKGTFLNFGSVQDQQNVLNYTRSVILVDISTHASSAMVGLPRKLRAFPRLKRSMLLFGVKDDDPSYLFCVQEKYDSAELTEHLALIGVPSNVMPEFAICQGLDQNVLEGRLVSEVYPTLKAMAGMLLKANKKAVCSKEMKGM